ncbi:mCG128631, isoform CRA_a [Mus musculus]|nr:mCG128631, isoform CRA_a [Mus musculus]
MHMGVGTPVQHQPTRLAALTIPPLMGLIPDLGRPAQPQTQGISALSSRRRSGCCLHILGESLLWHNSPARCWNSVCSHHTDMADLSQWYLGAKQGAGRWRPTLLPSWLCLNTGTEPSEPQEFLLVPRWWKSGEIWERSRLACKAALQISIISPACLLSAGACEKGSALESPTGGRMAVL